MVASPEVLGGGDSVAGHRLFDGPVAPALRFREEPLAHLAVGVRSHRAAAVGRVGQRTSSPCGLMRPARWCP